MLKILSKNEKSVISKTRASWLEFCSRKKSTAWTLIKNTSFLPWCRAIIMGCQRHTFSSVLLMKIASWLAFCSRKKSTAWTLIRNTRFLPWCRAIIMGCQRHTFPNHYQQWRNRARWWKLTLTGSVGWR